MASLPSYQEATSRVDWLSLVSPFVSGADYCTLCRVNRHFWTIFAPRIWADPLRTARRSGLDPGDDISWWFDFIFQRLPRVSATTRRLVRVLDVRSFGKDAYHFASDQNEVTVEQSFRLALSQLPEISAILLDGHVDMNPCFLVSETADKIVHRHRPALLSIAYCPNHLPATFFNSPSLQNLVYLDISGVPGSINALIQPSLVPNLRILKARHRELDDETIISMAKLFGLRLWSLDISDNKVTDNIVQTLREWCIPVVDLRSSAHFETEGKLVHMVEGTADHGNFVYLQESASSGTFDHPSRYLADAPLYKTDPSASASQQFDAVRSDGRSRIRDDSAKAATRMLSEERSHITDAYCETKGVTHIQLSRNNMSSYGLERLIRSSNGQLEYLACDLMSLLPDSSGHSNVWPKSMSLSGILGMAYIFRPVFSPNLQALRIHHSLVTNLPTLNAENISYLARIHMAEIQILPRVDQAYPQTYLPDMNPRLKSLTLTCIPRHSSGPLLTRLIKFLKQLAIQERAIEDTERATSSRRGSNMLLQGLRHLRLEFEPDATEQSFSFSEDLDAQELMDSGDPGFSFFNRGDDRQRSTSSPLSASSTSANRLSQSKQALHSSLDSITSPNQNIASIDFDDDTKEYIPHSSEWNGRSSSLSVWAGPTADLKTNNTCDTNRNSDVKAEYRRLVIECGVKEGLGLATPSQILAGVPDKSFIFHKTWCMAVMPPELKVPERAALGEMRDVLSSLRRYRQGQKAQYESRTRKYNAMGSEAPSRMPPASFWKGRLEVATVNSTADPHQAQYWR